MSLDYEIVTIGSGTVDYFADTDSELISIDTRTSHEKLIAFPLGSKILINELNTTTGGGGTNTAVSFARLGFRTAWLGKLGEDAIGDFVLEKMAAENVSFVGRREGKSGISFVLNSIGEDRTILTFKGSNNHLHVSDLPVVTTPWVYVSSMLEESWNTVVDYVAGNSFKVAFNPSNYQAKLGYARLKPLIDRVAILVMNREEACNFLGMDTNQRSDMPALVKALAKVPGQITAVTDGSKGVWVYDGKQVYAGTSTPGLKIAETTGAGDAFASTFTACIMKEMAVDAALAHAMTNAESVLQHKGAKERLLTWPELSQLVATGQRTLETC